MKLHLDALALRIANLVASFAAAAVLVACAASPNRAPVEERRPPPERGAAGAVAAAPAAAPAPVVEAGRAAAADTAARSGFYTVKPGDMLVRIALEHGQNWRDLQRWNNLDNPNLIEVGQVLRIAPPASGDPVAAARPVAPGGRVESRPLDPRNTGPAAAPAPALAAAPPGAAPPTAPAGAAASTAPAGAAASAAPATAASAPRPAAAREGDENIQWSWPATGPVATAFDEGRSKGLAITGKAGDPVLAAADGRVVYAGSGLRGYGNLVIVKHNAAYLTAYAHNQSLLVKDEQIVRKGQKIAEMGSSDAERVQLHFEVRRLGVPIDPMRVLPPR